MKSRCCELTDLRVNYFDDPIGIDEEAPRFSWRMDDSRHGAKQTAYQLRVKSSAGIRWDTGWVESGRSIQITYEGEPLLPLTQYSWQVRCRDMDGAESEWKQGSFETGFMTRKWAGTWIQGTNPGITLQPATCFRKEIRLPSVKNIRRARLYASALGAYMASMNGKSVSEDVLAPGWTDFQFRTQYRAYDIEHLLRKGANVVGITLGDGWYCSSISYWCTHSSPEKPHYGLPPAVRAEIFVEYCDGRIIEIGTDTTWRCSQGGPIRSSDIYHGEVYDSSMEMPGWDTPEFDASGWNQAVFTDRLQKISWSQSPPVRRQEPVKAVKVTSPKKGMQIIDFGQNLAGRERFSIRAEKGVKIVVRHGEMLNPDGTLYTENLGKAKATTTYISDGRPATYEPSFTFYGFRYIEITGLSKPARAADFLAIPIHSDMRRTGHFECSSSLVNRLYENVIWGQRSNYIDVPTDCPQRSERQGWTGDAQVFINAGSYNYHVGGFFSKWLVDLELGRNAFGEYPIVAPMFEKWSSGVSGWADAAIICPWTIYMKYGDETVLARHYEAMRNWIFFQRDNSAGLIRKSSEYADWLNMDSPTSEELVSTAFFAYGTSLMARIATILGRNRDARIFGHLFEDIRDAYSAKFIGASGKLLEKSQTAYLLTLMFKLSKDETVEEKMVKGLLSAIAARKNHLSTGFLGTPYLLPVLCEHGHGDLAYKLLEQTGYPSWLYPVTQGATTIWERWNSWTHESGFGPAGMNSFNHYAYGAVADFLYEHVGGIRTTEAGFRKFIIDPEIGGTLSYAKTEYLSEYGRIFSSWARKNGRISWTVVIPANTEAVLKLDAESVADVASDDIEITSLELTVPAGTYKFTMNGKRTGK